MWGPEVVYALNVTEGLAYLELDFSPTADLRLFLVSGDDSHTCLGFAASGGALIKLNVDPGLYFVVVDGRVAGTYFFGVHCSPATPTATPSPTPTSTRIVTPTRTSTPTITPLVRRIFLPLTITGARRSLLSKRWVLPLYIRW
jgi:hypothetical protein